MNLFPRYGGRIQQILKHMVKIFPLRARVRIRLFFTFRHIVLILPRRYGRALQRFCQALAGESVDTSIGCCRDGLVSVFSKLVGKL